MVYSPSQTKTKLKAVVTKCVKCNKRPSLHKRTRCQRCTDVMSLVQKRIKQRRLEQGICMFCGKAPAEKPLKRCRPCLNYLNKYSSEHKLKRVYGLDSTKRKVLYEKQGGFCAFCGDPLKSKFHIDHDHLTGVVRGLVHPTCNLMLGQYEAFGGRRFIAAVTRYLGDPL